MDTDTIKFGQARKLSDDELSAVSGGYINDSTWAYSYGHKITCPMCRLSNINDFSCMTDHERNVDIFTCSMGHTFAVDSNGKYYF